MKRVLSAILFVLLAASCSTAIVTSKKSLSPEEKETLLRERVASNWQAMIDRDRGKMYDLYDPFFRARITREWFIGQEMPIYYHGYKIEETDIQGNVATVFIKIEYEIKHMGLTGKEIKKDMTERVVHARWLFIDNNWYRQYFDNITEGTFVHY